MGSHSVPTDSQPAQTMPSPPRTSLWSIWLPFALAIAMGASAAVVVMKVIFP